MRPSIIGLAGFREADAKRDIEGDGTRGKASLSCRK